MTKKTAAAQSQLFGDTMASGNKKRTPARRSRSTAERMAGKQREISVSEFFTKNRHLLGFDSPRKALLTAVKEAVDNSLDACEEAQILPELLIELSGEKTFVEELYRSINRDFAPYACVGDEVHHG